MRLETTMAIGWCATSILMAVHIVGRELCGWSTSHVSWWLAFAGLLGMAVANTYTYFGAGGDA